MRDRWVALKTWFLGLLVWLIYYSLFITWKIEISEPESMRTRLKNKEPLVMAHWHGDELILLGLIAHYRVATMVSTSRDGDLMAELVRRFQGRFTRGSSTRKGIGALIGLIKMIKKERLNSSVAVDGPKGPIHKVKPGVFEMARLAGFPIVAGGTACDRAWHFPKAWNKTYLPKPFAKVRVVWQEPLILQESDDPKSPELAQKLEVALHHARETAANSLRHPSAGVSL